MNTFLCIVVLITGLNYSTAKSEEKSGTEDADEYTTMDLMTLPKSVDIFDEEKSSREDGIIELDNILKSSEFDKLNSPELPTTQVRRFADPLKDHLNDEVFKTAKLDLKSKDSTDELQKKSIEVKSSGKEQDTSDRKENKSAIKEEKSAKAETKTKEAERKSEKEMEKKAKTESKSVKSDEKSSQMMEVDKKADSEIKDEIQSRTASSEDEEKMSKHEHSGPHSGFNTKYSDDMDDLIYPYFLEKFRKSNDDEVDERSYHSENKNDDDLLVDDDIDINFLPTRRMFHSSPPPILNNRGRHGQVEVPRINSSPHQGQIPNSQKLIGADIPGYSQRQNIQHTFKKPPLPYVNNINPRVNYNHNLPQNYHPTINNFRQPPYQKPNVYSRMDFSGAFPNNKFYNFNPLTLPPSLSTPRGKTPVEINPILQKLSQASHNPRHNIHVMEMPKSPTLSRNFYNPYNANPIHQFQQNFHPYSHSQRYG